jgi:predicted transcriptional regulator
MKYGMRSVRLDTALEAQLEEAARLSGEPVSQIIRRAIESQCREILGERLAPRLRDVIGVVKSAGGRATRTGEAFTEVLKKSKARR